MQTINLKLQGKYLTAEDEENSSFAVVGDNRDYYIHFDIDEPKRAMFAVFSEREKSCRTPKQESVLIDENGLVNVPMWILKWDGFSVGVVSDGFASTPLYIYVVGSIIDKTGIQTEDPPPSQVEQLIKLVNDLQMKGIDEAELKRLIEEYITTHPIGEAGNGVKAANVNADGELVLILANDTEINCGKQGLTEQQVKALIDEAISHIAKFDGDYEVTPKVTAQTLSTKSKLMTDDLTVGEIPTFEVGNDFGTTFYIGKEL